jgi:uncharacterized protein (TIGR02246 family)
LQICSDYINITAMSSSTGAAPDTVLVAFAEAWNRGDAAAFARLFTTNATYVAWIGDLLQGRREIADVHAQVFDAWQPGQQVRLQAIHSRLLDANTAVVVAVGGLGRGSIAFDKFQTFVLLRQDSAWQIAAFHNTAMSDRSLGHYSRETA